MEIIATFPIQLYISIYSTLRFNFSKAYIMFLCRLFQHSVWGDQYSQSCQLHHIVQSELMGVSACVSLVEQSLMCATVYKHERWSLLYHWSGSIFGWTAQYVPSVTSPLLLIPQAIYLSFYTTTCYHSEDLLYVKVGHDHLYTYSFTILYVYCDMQRMTQ